MCKNTTMTIGQINFIMTSVIKFGEYVGIESKGRFLNFCSSSLFYHFYVMTQKYLHLILFRIFHDWKLNETSFESLKIIPTQVPFQYQVTTNQAFQIKPFFISFWGIQCFLEHFDRNQYSRSKGVRNCDLNVNFGLMQHC